MTRLDRRDFLKLSLAAGTAGAASAPWLPGAASQTVVVDAFDRPDSYFHGSGWESLTPGYWQIKNGALRRRLMHRGDDVSENWRWFPWHWETIRNRPMPVSYDPSLPVGLIFRRDWKLRGGYRIEIDAAVRERAPSTIDYPRWKQFQPGYGLIGVAFGSNCLHEGWTIDQVRGGKPGHPAWMACWRDDARFGIYDHGTAAPEPVRAGAEKPAFSLGAGDSVVITVDVEPRTASRARVTAAARANGSVTRVTLEEVDRVSFTEGYFGLVARGLLDFEVTSIRLNPNANQPLHVPTNDLHVAYPLGETLRREGDRWHCRFVALYRSDGREAALRISEDSDPPNGWEHVPIAGTAPIVSNEFRRRTALIDVVLPANPAETALYYTVWKDGKDVTGDPRLGTDSVGEGTGYTGRVPAEGTYVGRLPRLAPPYRFCGLSCHAITGNNPELPRAGKYEGWWVHDQPTPEAFQHLEAYEFQVMVWEDDVWYLELIYPPPSVDDAYKVITTTLGGPTTRWQMMRHWNVINPGDHDHGMDDVKGPEQIIIRTHEGLGQDPEYMRRNFQIVSHLVRGLEAPSGRDNPKRWRRWRMPGGDFSLLMLDARLWRTSQDTRIWDDEGWGHRENLYGRDNPTRALLGEEQFAWLREIVRTDPSPLLLVTGINGLHTVWTDRDGEFKERHKSAADYAGWVTAGADRVLDLLGSRQGIVSVYGDVHTGCIMESRDQRVLECCFGAIGRYGSRGLKPGFGREMVDFDGRDLIVHALYHDEYRNPEQDPIDGPRYWNMLAMQFDPRDSDPAFTLKLHNIIDPPSAAPRGGGSVERRASRTGRPPSSRLPAVKTLPDAGVLLSAPSGRPIRGLRSLPDGTLPAAGLVDIPPGTQLVMTAYAEQQSDAQILITESI